jgi:transcription termination factor Rho
MTNEELIERQAQLLDDFSDRHDSDTELIKRAAARIREQHEDIESLVLLINENAETLLEAEKIIQKQAEMIQFYQKELSYHVEPV